MSEARMPKLNRKIILYNIQDAREELQRIEAMLSAKSPPGEGTFQVAMQHAFHHLNFAWNIRHWPSERYANLSDRDFKTAGEFPTDLAFDDD
jgi:hypothetical protein